MREELAAKSVRAAAEINRRDGRIEELQKAYAHIDQLLQGEQAQRNQLLAELERAAGNLGNAKRAQAQLDRVRRNSKRAPAICARPTGDLHKLRERFAQSNQLLQKTSVRLADFETRNASLTERLRKQLLEMKRLLRLLDQIDDAADLLRKSRRWKMANPFRRLDGDLKRQTVARLWSSR